MLKLKVQTKHCSDFKKAFRPANLLTREHERNVARIKNILTFIHKPLKLAIDNAVYQQLMGLGRDKGVKLNRGVLSQGKFPDMRERFQLARRPLK